MTQIVDFAKMITEEAMNYHTYGRSSLWVATLIFPPKIAWFKGDGPCPYPPNRNKLETIMALNGRITLFNHMLCRTGRQPPITEDKTRIPTTPQLHQVGIETSIRHEGSIRRLVTHHNWKCWRPTKEPADTMHLTDSERAKIGRAINEYYISQKHV